MYKSAKIILKRIHKNLFLVDLSLSTLLHLELKILI